MDLTIEQALKQGVAAHRKGNYQEAERLYRAILKIQPAHPDANHNLGVLAVAMKKTKLALSLFKLALEENPKIEQFWLSYIGALIKEKQFENAREVCDQCNKAGFFGEKLDAIEVQLIAAAAGLQPSQDQLNRLLEFYQGDRYNDAETLAKSMAQQFPEHQFSWKVLGVIFKETGRLSDSLVASQKSLKLAPKDEEACNNLGITQRELGKFNEAEASFRQATALKSDYVEAHSNLGITLKELGRLDEAESSLMKAITLQPDYPEAHYNLGLTLKEQSRLKEAEASYMQAIVLKPDYTEAHNNLGNTLKEQGKLEEAEESYTQAIILNPNNTTAFLNRWQLFFEKGEFESALRDADFCDSKNSRVCGLETLYALGRTDEIYRRIEKLAELDDENIAMAAFAAFITARENKKTAHDFCTNPLSFINFSNLSSHLYNPTEFLREVIDELNEVQTIWEPPQKSTSNGLQTPAYINLFENPSEKISLLHKIIIAELDAYHLKYRNETCSYIKKWPLEKNIWGWHVILKNQGYQDPHIHPGGWLSGVIYLKVVPSLEKNEGAIEFSLNGEHYSDVKSPKLIHQPESGDIVFFPSSLHHRTIPFTTNTDRIIISFDLIRQSEN